MIKLSFHMNKAQKVSPQPGRRRLTSPKAKARAHSIQKAEEQPSQWKFDHVNLKQALDNWKAIPNPLKVKTKASPRETQQIEDVKSLLRQITSKLNEFSDK